MRIFKFLLFFFLLFFAGKEVFALSISYGTVLSTKGSEILVQNYGIDTKQYYICSTVTAGCAKTKKTSLGVAPTLSLPESLKQELDEKDAHYLTLSSARTYLAYYIDGSDAKPTRIYTVRDMKRGTEYTISSSTSYWDLVADQGRVFDFSPDEKKLVYLDDRDGSLALYLVDTATLTEGSITSTKLPLDAYQADDFLFADNDTLFYVGNSVANPYIWSLHRLILSTGKDSTLESNVSYVDPLRKVGKTIVFNRLQKNGYGVEMYNLSSKKIVQFKVPNISTKRSLDTQEVVVSNTLRGIIMEPAKYNPKKEYPLVIWMHGGPYRQASYGFHPYHSYGIYDAMLNLLQKNNVIVLKLDYRGSFGFGRAFAEGIKGSVGTGDVEDVMNALAYAKNRYHISNTYLFGNSYGGYLSLKALAEHPNDFSGAMSINGVTDWESLLLKMKTSIFNTEFNGLPDINNRALYDQASIANKIGNIGNQKIAIVAGEADRTIPFWQATDMYDKLKSAGKNVTLVSYKGEDHVYKGKKTISSLCKEMFTFIGQKPDKECTK